MSKNKPENRNVNASKNRKLLARKLSNNLWFFIYVVLMIFTINIFHKIMWVLEILSETTFIIFGVMIVVGILFIAVTVNRNNDTESFK